MRRVAVLLLLGGAAISQEGPSTSYERAIRPLLARYCHSCHGGKAPKADLDLAAFADEAAVLRGRRLWRKALDTLHSREMPPEGKPQPDARERERLTDWLEELLARPDASGQRNPGRPVLRRLNRVEYNNTVLDLFGLPRPASYYEPAKGMPPTLSFNPLKAGRRMVADLPHDDADYGFDNIGEVLTLPPFLFERYLAAAREVGEAVFTDKSGALVARQVRDWKDRTKEGARAFLAGFLPRAFRGPAEVEPYGRLFDRASAAGAPFEEALRTALEAVLVSPRFLYRVEPDAGTPGVRPVTDMELASRLSYFLWSSMPDAELFAVARKGTLRTPDVLEAQVRRLLKDRRSKELAENFALQWLQLAGVEAIMPDPQHFKAFYAVPNLPRLFRQEALLLFETVLVEDRSVLDLVAPDWGWSNPPLRRFYGLPEPAPEKSGRDAWVRTTFPDARRGGVLALGGVLAATSLPTRTSPVRRGKWILEAILGTPPPPPPADVPDLEEEGVRVDGATLRRRLEQHRSNPNCAGCHRRLDPLGFVLENYDPTGAWREEGDAAATLADGSALRGLPDLKRLLSTTRRRDFVRCLAEHLLTFALGRKLEYYDRTAVQEIVSATERDGYRFSRLVVEVARSVPFLQRRTEEARDDE